MAAPRRNTELGLLLLAGIVVAAAYVLASLGQDSQIPVNVGPFLLFVFGLFGVAHMVTRRVAPDADPILLPMAVLLNGIGYVFITRLDDGLAWQQAIWTGVGVGAYCVTLIGIPRARVLDTYRWTAAVVGVLLLLLPLVPGLGREINGSRIWVGFAGMSFQPGEFAKIALAIFFTSYLVEKRELLSMSTWRFGPLRLPDPRHLAPVLLAWLVSVLVMVFQKDLGSSLLFFALFLTLLWVATQRIAYVVVGLVLFGIGAWLAFSSFGHVQDRVDIWLDPWTDPKGTGFQVVEASFAMAFGGLTGTGLGLSGTVGIPAAENDFIFAVIAQELGLIGATAVLCAYLLIVGSGLRAAQRADTPFESLLAAGLTALLGFQAFVIIGGVIRLLPLTGVTLPFVSYGGSSLIANYVLLAIVVRVSSGSHRPEERATRTARRVRKAEAEAMAT